MEAEIKKDNKEKISIGLFTGAIFGLFAFVGTLTAQYFWWYISRLDEIYIHLTGAVGYIVMIVLAILAIRVAIKWLK